MKPVLFVLVLLILVTSCHENKEQTEYHVRSENKTIVNLFDLDFPERVKLAKTVRGKLDFDPELATVDSSNLIKRIKFVYLSTDIDSGEISRDLITKSNNYKAYSDTIGDTEVFEFEIHFEEKGAQKLTLYLEDIIVVKNDSAPMKMSIKTYEYSGQKEVFVED